MTALDRIARAPRHLRLTRRPDVAEPADDLPPEWESFVEAAAEEELAARVIASAGRLEEPDDVARARDRLRLLLRDEAIVMEPRGDRYVARGALLPEMMLGGARGVVRIAGARTTDDATEIPWEIELRAAA